ncbi:hypothetical protein ACNOYE_24605 [Nannocystaceae bacterium ST9]
MPSHAIQPKLAEDVKWELTQYEREGAWFVNGLAEGETRGHLQGKRESLLMIARKRGLVLTDDQLTLLEQCTDEAELDAWIDRALEVTSADALFG